MTTAFISSASSPFFHSTTQSLKRRISKTRPTFNTSPSPSSRPCSVNVNITPRADAELPGPPSSSYSDPSSSVDENAIVEGPFTGQYGQYYVREHDVMEVLTYRAFLLLSALSIFPCLTLPLTPLPTSAGLYDALTLLSAVSFGMSLKYIHIYMRDLHQALKVVWSVGMVGCAASFVLYHSIAHAAAVDHPAVLLASGWIIVALQGVFIKETLCFGKKHVAFLCAAVPALAGGHFTGLLGPRGGPVELALSAVVGVGYLWFSASKFRQDPKDDLGDLSVFEHMDKIEIEKQREMARTGRSG